MAEKKKSAAEKKTTAKNTKPKAESAKEKRERETREKERAEAKRNKKRQGIAIIFFCASLFMLVLAIIRGGIGSVFNSLHCGYISIFGFCGYALPIVIAVFSLLISKYDNSGKAIKFLLCALFALISVSSFWTVLKTPVVLTPSIGDIIRDEFGSNPTYGGFFGAVVGGLIYRLTCSKFAAAVIIALIFAVTIIIFARITVSSIFKPVEKTGRRIQTAGKEQVENIRQRNEIRREEKETRRISEAQISKQKIDEPVYKEPFDFGKNKKKSPVEPQPLDEETIATEANVLPKDTPKPPVNVPDVSAVASSVSNRKKARKPETFIFDEPTPQEQTSDSTPEQNTDTIDDILDKKPEYTKKPESLLDDIVEKTPSADELYPSGNYKHTTENLTLDQLTDKAMKDTEEKEKVRKMKASEVEEAIESVAAEIEENAVEEPEKEYILPALELLAKPEGDGSRTTRDELKQNGEKLIAALASFNVEAKILDIVPGPSVTRYELSPAAGVKINKFLSLSDDLALHLASPAGIRMEAPIPGKAAIGIEIPNRTRATVTMRECIDCDEFRNAKSKLQVVLGRDIAGSPVFADLAKMPHLLIAGTTGSGKSVCLNTMLVSILYHAKPDEVKLLLIDPKTVEFSIYNDIPHLIVPVVNDARKAAGALGWAVTEMLNRYKILNDNNVRDLGEYNKLCDIDDSLKKMPQIVIVIDELSDLMSVAPSEVEDAITRLAQMARAAGIHLVVATQRPSVDVITGLIKANIPSRIALSVSSQIDSRTILDSGGAEKLLGNGDMLFWPTGKPKPTRVQGCYISTSEINHVCEFVKNQESGEYDSSIQEEIERQAIPEKKKIKDTGDAKANKDAADEEIIEEAIRWFSEDPARCSGSSMQRHFGLGFQRAGRILDLMERRGYIGPVQGSKPRQLLITPQQYLAQKALNDEMPETEDEE